MKKEAKEKAKNITLEIIDFFLGIPEALVSGFDRKDAYRVAYGHFNDEQSLTCDNIAKIFYRLKKRGLVEIKKTNSGESIRFTDKARLVVVDRITSRNGCDGTKRFVSFDIPEPKRLSRDQFRRTIKRMGFKQIQKSLWVTDRIVGDLVDIAAKEYGIQDYVVYIVSDNTNINKTIDQILKQ
ncbi:MAG: hypothetical protein WC107_02855 [Patescibacteria group bacterium]